MSESSDQKRPRLAYLFSRYPVPSQSFCDWEMLGIQEAGEPVLVASLNPPATSFRRWDAEFWNPEVLYPPPNEVLKAGDWEADLGALVAEHDTKYGAAMKSGTRARNAWYFARALKARGVEHVHVHFANRAAHTAIFLREMGVTYSLTAHAQDFMVDVGSDELLQEMCAKAEFVAAVSDFSRGLLVEKCPDSEEKIVRLYNGIDLSWFDGIDGGVGDGVFRMVTVGRLVAFKGFNHLVDVCAGLKEAGITVRCDILGEGPKRRELEGMIQEAGLEDEVILRGIATQEEIREAMGDADAFVLPAIVDAEGASDILPTVIIEAMASGLPVVSTRLAGIPEMVVEGKSGMLVDPGDSTSMIEGLSELQRDPALALRMGAEGKRLAEQFDYRKTSRLVLERILPSLSEALPRKPKIAYLVSDWDGTDPEIAAAMNDDAFQLVVCGLVSGAKIPPSAEGVIYLPDAIAQESVWLADAEWRAACDDRKLKLPSELNTEEFYSDARRAAVLRGMGFAGAHAHREEGAVLASLISPENYSVTVSGQTTVHRKVADVLVEGAKAASVGDPKVKGADQLGLALPESKRVKIGPIKLKSKPVELSAPSAEVVSAWLKTVKEELLG